MINHDLIPVPAHIRAQKCKYCPATIYMVRIEHRWTPIHCAVPGGEKPTATAPGKGINHFMDCEKAETARADARAKKLERQATASRQGELL